MRFHCATVLVVLSICAPQREHCWRCNANGRSQNALSFLHQKENAPCHGNNHKNASLSAIGRYISITTIYTVRNLQIFNAGNFFSSKHYNYLLRKKHLFAIVFNETINHDFILIILLRKQGRTELIYSIELTSEHVFENVGRELYGCSPSNCRIIARLVSITWNSGSQILMSRGPLQKTLNTCGHLIINENTQFWPLLLLEAPARPLHVVPREQLLGPKGGRGPRLRNPDLETRVANVWDLVQSDQ